MSEVIDGVYAGYDGFGIWLHANSHEDPADRIYLEPQVLRALNEAASQLPTFGGKTQVGASMSQSGLGEA